MDSVKARIAVLSYEFSKHTRAKKIVRSLLKRGYRVTVWEPRKPVNRGPRLLRAILNYVHATFSLLMLRADIYWVESIPDIIYLPLALTRRTYIYDRRSPWYLDVLIEFNNRILSTLAGYIERVMMRWAKIIVVVCETMEKELTPLNKKIVKIPNYPSMRLKKLPDRNLRRKLKVYNKKIILYVGRLNYVTGVQNLPRIVESISNRRDCELWIIGDGPARWIVERLTRKYPDIIKWFGWVPHHEVPSYILAADLCIAMFDIKKPFHIYYSHEGVQKISEYLLFSKPVIVGEIMKSPYYLSVKPEELGKTIVAFLDGKIKMQPPPIPTWEEYCEPKVVEAVEQIVNTP